MPAAQHAPTPTHASPDLTEELDRQIQVLVDLGYPALLDRTERQLRDALEPLRDVVARLRPDPASAADPDDHVPFVVVLDGLELAAAASRMSLAGRPARLMLTPEEIPQYVPLDVVRVPVGVPLGSSGATPGPRAYLLSDVDTGSEFCDVTPETALTQIVARGRTPLTIAEGVALVTQRPDKLRKNRCFSLAGSRRGDQRVPAIWISERAPKLGWCWDRNPHTWLGTASAGARSIPV
ncbi:hypothetical protein GCM10011331_02170 [Flavimobilis marinus]|uniref:Uncharacterized protein n=1 Tax=Flavimobilis marinus TaxID=285351 RepID=A0A1I2DXA5_9MICO|nr:DUF5701 family protein [Flavimobilis marinus]GHG44068.1 hypothetical protein GCM10011331_02170 [Flavimobilis marinus]SFE85274.1 hypothetical protein SAMN04488035_0789 [Flavimobilis marinus]